MITQWLLEFFAFFGRSLFTTFDALIPDPPGWWSGVHDAFGAVASFISPAGFWLPTGVMLTVTLSVMALNAVHIAMVIARRIASYMTLGGGAL